MTTKPVINFNVFIRFVFALVVFSNGALLSNTALADDALMISEGLKSDMTKGKDLYLNAGGYGCHVCHGLVAQGAGQVGGYIRGASLETMLLSLDKTPEMMPLKPSLTAQELVLISRYISNLKSLPLVSVDFKNDQWQVSVEPLTINQPAQIVIYNDSFSTQIADLTAIGLDVFSVEPLATLAIDWPNVDRSFLDVETLLTQ